jgi:G3E family GTPase
VALTSSDTTKRTKCTQQSTAVPLPLPAHALIKIEDGNAHHSSHHHHHQPTTLFEQEKSIHTASIATAVQTPTEISGQLFYQHPGLIQIAPQPPQPPMAHQANSSTSMSSLIDAGIATSPPPLQPVTSAIATHSTGCISDTQMNLVQSATIAPEVQDANIQTSPIMSEDDNSTGHDGVMDTHINAEFEEESQESTCEKPVMENEPEISREATKEHRESVPDNSVTSSSLIVIKQQIESPDISMNEAKCNEESMPEKEQEQKEPVDLSGLQLLSNSIDVFQKKIIKQEPQVGEIYFSLICRNSFSL